jgi:hypothetical protein
MQTTVTGRPPPATWWEFWREVARRAARGVRSLWSAPGQAAWARPLLLVIGFQIKGSLATLEKANAAFPYLMATQTAVLAAPFIWASGLEVLPVGGFTGTIPEPTLPALKHLIRTGFVATFLQSPPTTDPRLTRIARYCMNVTPRAAGQRAVLPLAVYICLAPT